MGVSSGAEQSPDAENDRYPVIDSAELNPVPRRRFGRGRRPIGDLPRQPPGSVLVFQLGDLFEYATGGALQLDDSVVVEAVAVTVVSVRHTMRVAEVQLPTADPTVCVAMRARFHCWVNDPLLVVESGCWDIDPMLAAHLVEDRRLWFLASACDITAQWPAFRRNAHARLMAYHDIHPFVAPGLTTRFVDVALQLQQLSALPKPRPPATGTSGPEATGPYIVDGEPPRDGPPEFVPDDYSWDKTND